MFGQQQQSSAAGTTGTSSLFGSSAPSGGFSFGGGASGSNPSGGFTFGQTPTSKPAATSGGFTFGSISTNAQPQPQATSSFSFGGGSTAASTTKPSSTTSGFSLGGTTPATTQSQQPATGFSLGGGAPGGFKFGDTAKQPTATTTAGGGGFTFGATPSSGTAATPASTAGATTGGFSLGGGGGLKLGTVAPSTINPTSGAAAQPSLGATAIPAAGGLGGGGLGGFATPTSTTQSAVSTGLKLGTTSTTSAPGGLTIGSGLTPATGATGGLKLGGLGAAKPSGAGLTFATPTTSGAASSTTGLQLGAKTTTTTAAGTGLTTFGAKTTTTTVGSTGPAETMSYRELEESINKWTVELEEQEKSFLHQAAQVNAWDRALVKNGEKITSLHNDLEKVKADQQRLEHECDYIVAQQRELEDILVPLEEACKIQEGSLYRQHTDVERERTYQMAENIDSQLKRMVQDLKEIIDHMNTSNTTMDQADPVNQVAKILNAHMNSLQWIDQNTSLVQRKVDEVTRQYEIIKRDQERNVHLAFE